MPSTDVQPITEETIAQAMSYAEYQRMIDDLLEEGKTTGPKQTEGMTKYTRKNVERMNRLDQEIELKPSLKDKLEAVKESWIWLVLTEGWCGDAAQNIPVLNKMAEASSQIELKLILRDEHHDIIDEYLTNGGRSIPKLVCLHAELLKEIGSWGPRPGNFQQKAMDWKDDDEISNKEWANKLHQWYDDDQTETLQNEFEQLVGQWK